MAVSSIKHNMLMANANRQLNVNTKTKAKTAERLSSGYKINRAADDAAGLSISEKMRWMIRGLNQGTENAQDGVSWVQIGDGSLEETHAMLHRMTELAIKSSNGTCTDADRAMMQVEFDQLQTEIDRLTDNTYFNEKHIFKEHEYPYYQIEGNIVWEQDQLHKIREGENDLVITYRKEEKDQPTTATITVDAGEYTTQELIDEIDTAFEKAGLLKKGLMFEYTDLGTCNLNLEDGEKIDEISGGLSYLLYDNFGGGDLGALIGTTSYSSLNSGIKIIPGLNDEIHFTLIDPEDVRNEHNTAVEIGFPVTITGSNTKTKKELMELLQAEVNGALSAKGINPRVDTDGDGVEDADLVKVEEYGKHIKMSSEQYILSEFWGNMFKVDDYGTYTSIFYDNIHEVQNVHYVPAEFQGAYVLQYTASGDAYDEQASVFHIKKGVNNLLVLKPNETGQEITLDLTDLHGQTLDGKTMEEACGILNTEIANLYGADIPLKFQAVKSSTTPMTDSQGNRKLVGYTAMQIVSEVAEPGKKVGIVKSKSTAYNTLFAQQSVSEYHNDARCGGIDNRFDSNAKLTGGRNLANGLAVTDDNNMFRITIGRVGQQALTADIKLDNSPAGGKYSLADLQDQIQQKLNDAFSSAPAEMKDDQGRVIVVSNSGGHIVLTGATEKTASIRVGAVGANEGYTDIFPDQKIIPKSSSPTNPSQTATLVPPVKGAKFETDGSGNTIVTIPSAHDGDFVVYVDGQERRITGADNLYNAAPGKDGKWKLEDLKAYIDKKLAPVVTPKTFNPFSVSGEQDEITLPTGTISDSGYTNSYIPSFNAVGGSTWTGLQGEGGEMTSTRSPQLTTKSLGISSTTPFTFTSQEFTITRSDGTSRTFQVALNKSYSNINTLKSELQTAIDNACDKKHGQVGGIIVDVSGGGLKFTVNMGAVNTANVLDGQGTTLSMNTNTNSTNATEMAKSQFLKDLYGTKYPAEITIGASEDDHNYYYAQTKGVNDSFMVGGTAQTLKFKVKTPGSTKETAVNVTLAKNTTYNKTSLKAALNAQLNKVGYKADYDANGQIVITGDDAHSGDNYSISFDADGSKGAMNYIFGYPGGKLTKGYQASGTLPLQMQKKITITSGKQNFKIKVDGGTEKTVKLTAGTYGEGGKYTLQELLDQIVKQTQVSKKNTITATVDAYGNVSMATVSANGPNSKIEITYDDSATSAMPDIFGYTQKAGAEINFVEGADGKYTVELTRKIDDRAPDPTLSYYRKVQVVSDKVDAKEHSTGYQGGSFIYSDTRDDAPEYDDGYHSTMYSYMQGVSLAGNGKLEPNGKIQIDQYNNKLTFYFSDNYGTASQSVQKIEIDGTDLPDGLYTPEELRDKLQEAINKKTGNVQKINVKYQNGGIRLESANAGRRYWIYGNTSGYRPSGSFYDKVLCSSRTKSVGKDIIKDTKGAAAGGEVYAVGRQDLKNKEVKIQKDGNDYLTLEFTYPPAANAPSKTVRLEMTLDPGYYKGEALEKQIQKQLDKALEEAGLPKGLIEAGIGNVKHNVVVSGAINDRALGFKLSETVKGPAEGAYKIQAIGGTAAFSIFYATEGDIARAYIRGGKDISGGVEIKEGQEEFSVDIDGKTYKIGLTAGKYTAEELVAHMNSVMHDDPGNKVPLVASIDEGRLKLMHSRYGKHKISNLQGRIKDKLFFAEKGAKVTEDPIYLRVSGVSGDWIDIERPWMNTMSLGINSLTISKYKYAQKAIGRLKEAVTKVSDVRSYFGAKQNRLESTIRNNMNKAENTTAAESRIRDADISKEAVENSIHSILEQTGVSMMAQTRQNADLVLQLLS